MRRRAPSVILGAMLEVAFVLAIASASPFADARPEAATPAPPADVTVTTAPAEPAPAPVDAAAAPSEPTPTEPAPVEPAPVEPPFEVVEIEPTPTPTPMEGGGFVLVPATTAPPKVEPVPVDRAARGWRRSASVLVGVGSATFLGSLFYQGFRHHSLRECRDVTCEVNAYTLEPTFGAYTVLLHSMTVAAGAGAGAMLGHAAATEDVLGRGELRRRPGVLAGGIVLATAGGIAYTTIGLTMYRQQRDAEDPAALQLRRFLIVDSLVVATSIGAGMMGYAIGYRQHGRALQKIRVAAQAGRGSFGVSASGRF